MIYLQKPHAKKVCGKKAWESMGRTINQNALPIVLFFPSITMTEPAEEFKIDNVAQAVGNTDVSMYSKDWEHEQDFESITAALKFLNKTDSESSRLKKACQEEWRIYMGHHWKVKKS